MNQYMRMAADRDAIEMMRKHAVTALRIALGIVFLWFGALKIFGASPVENLIAATYSFLPLQAFMMALGIWEVAIGAGLLAKRLLRVTLLLLWAQMLGTLASPLLYPDMFIVNGNPLLLTTEGEFVVKNLVLIAAGAVIGGYEIKPK